jgi:predicted GIY-YIG superfamily endonuclease
MTDSARSKRRSTSHESAIAKLARQTNANEEVVRHLYDEEIAALQKEAAVKGFIGVIAARRVKQRLLASAAHATAGHPGRAHGGHRSAK